VTYSRRDTIKFLADLPKSAVDAINSVATKITLKAGDVLFEQNEIANELYLVVSGTVGVFVSANTSKKLLIALIGKGESVGEAGIISDETRSASVIALRDCELLRLNREQFHALSLNNPTIAITMNKVLAERLVRSSQSQIMNIKPKVISFIAASEDTNITATASRLADKISNNFSQSVYVHSTSGFEENGYSLSELEEKYDLVILCCNDPDTEWTKTCVRQSDRICLIAGYDQKFSNHISQQVLNVQRNHQMIDLIILHDAPKVSIKQTNAFLEKVQVNRHFHINAEKASDWDRLSRIVTGNGVGIVLSGGGARAYAHLGVIRALQEANIPIDFIGGTSMGGVIAASIAMGENLDLVEQQIRKCFVTSNPLSDYTLPLNGLVRGNKVEAMLDENFGDMEINDLWLPFFCVSTNLTNATSHVHNTGKISTALRASISLPGILPPVITDEGVLVDGGVINNLPAEEMSHVCYGPIIAVDVSRDLAVTPQSWRKMTAQPFWRRALSPPVISLLVRAGTVSGVSEYKQQTKMAHVNLNPALGMTDILDWKAFDETVQLGYEYTIEQIATNPCLSDLANIKDNFEKCGL